MENRSNVMVLGVGGFAQSVMQILSDDGAIVSCGLTRDYGHFPPSLVGPTFDLSSKKSIQRLIDINEVDLVIPMSIDWAKMPWADDLLKSSANLFSPIDKAMLIERDRDFAGELCRRYNVPFPKAYVARNRLHALEIITRDPKAFVIKNPLCSPKSPVHTITCETPDDTRAWLERVNYAEGVFLQEYLGRKEAGHIALVVGGEVHSLVTNQEYKRAFAGNMGVVAGAPMGGLVEADPDDKYGLAEALLHPLKPWFAETGFTGPIQATGIYHDSCWHAIEYNIRLGMTATPMILRMLEKPTETLMQLYSGVSPKICFRKDLKYGVSLTLAGYGYPYIELEGPSVPIIVNSDFDCDVWWNEIISRKNGEFFAAGHRIADVVAFGGDLSAALTIAYENIGKIRCLGSYYRPDIGATLWPPKND